MNSVDLQELFDTIACVQHEGLEGNTGDMADAADSFPMIDRAHTFQDKMILTNDEGIILTMEDGSQYYLIVKRRF